MPNASHTLNRRPLRRLSAFLRSSFSLASFTPGRAYTLAAVLGASLACSGQDAPLPGSAGAPSLPVGSAGSGGASSTAAGASSGGSLSGGSASTGGPSSGGMLSAASGGASSGGFATEPSGGRAEPSGGAGGGPRPPAGGGPSGGTNSAEGGAMSQTGGRSSNMSSGGTSAGAGPGQVGGGSPAGGSNAAGSTNSGDDTPPSVYLAGDSTVSTYADSGGSRDQAGWGQMLPEFFDSRVKIVNRAIGGRTARRFIDEGYLDAIETALRPGDYLLVQFGTNDGNKTASYTLNGQTIPYYLEPGTDFKKYILQYIERARAKQANVVLVTPPPRNSAYCTGGNGTGAHAQALREVAQAEGLALSDLNALSVAHLKAICPAPTPEDFFFVRADGSVDGTHFQENGARILARLVSQGLSQAKSPLANYLRP